jgi:spore germination protein KB
MWIVINMHIFHIVMLLPGVTTTAVGRDGWISEILATLGGIGLLWFVSVLELRFPRESIIEYAPRVLGTLLGKLVGLLYVWLCLHMAMIVFRDVGELVTSISMPETPVEVLMAIMAIVVGYGAKRGIEVIARVNDFFLPISIGALLFISGTVAKDVDLRSLMPILEKGVKLPLLGAAPSLAIFALVVATSTLLVSIVDRPERIRRGITIAFLFAGGLDLLMSVGVLTAFGPEEARNMNFPMYELARLISIGDFLDRIEVLLLGAWINMAFAKAGTFFYLGATSLARWLGLKDYRPLVTPLGVLMVALSLRLYDNVREMIAVFRPEVMLPYALLVALVIPALILAVALIRGQKGDTG